MEFKMGAQVRVTSGYQSSGFNFTGIETGTIVGHYVMLDEHQYAVFVDGHDLLTPQWLPQSFLKEYTPIGFLVGDEVVLATASPTMRGRHGVVLHVYEDQILVSWLSLHARPEWFHRSQFDLVTRAPR